MILETNKRHILKKRGSALLARIFDEAASSRRACARHGSSHKWLQRCYDAPALQYIRVAMKILIDFGVVPSNNPIE
jgi:hypothetical protein